MRLRLTEIWWMVSPQNPLKPTEGMAGLQERLSAAQAVAKRDRRIRVSAIEQVLGTRATIDTLTGLKRKFPRTEFFWLMGADNLAQISKWRRWDQIFRRCRIAVFTRPSYDLKGLGSKAAQRFARSRIPERAAPRLYRFGPPGWVFLNFRGHTGSATAIRDQINSQVPGKILG